MLGGGQAGGGTMQRLSLACPHQLQSRWRPGPSHGVPPFVQTCPTGPPAGRLLPPQHWPSSCCSCSVPLSSLRLRSPEGCRVAWPCWGHPDALSPVGEPATSCQVAPQIPEFSTEQARPPSAWPWGLKGLQPWAVFPFWTWTLLKQGSPRGSELGDTIFAQDQPSVGPAIRRDSCGEGVRAVGRATCPAPASSSACQAQTCSARVASPVVLHPLQRGGAAQHHTPSLCTFWGLLVLGTSLPTAAGEDGQAAGDRVALSTICNTGGRSPAEGCGPRAWDGFAENVTLVRNCET